MIFGSVENSDPGSGAFWPWIRDPEKVFSESRISDPGSQTHIFDSLVTNVW